MIRNAEGEKLSLGGKNHPDVTKANQNTDADEYARKTYGELKKR